MTTIAAVVQQTQLKMLKGDVEINPSDFLVRWVPLIYGVEVDTRDYGKACDVELQIYGVDLNVPSRILWLANEYYELLACFGMLPRRTI